MSCYATSIDYQYTGQRSYLDSLGLHYYVARWYDPVTAHFAQADSIIPQPGNSGDWNRYAYVLYNPMKYTDPTGHWPENPFDDLPNWINYAAGATIQYANDRMMGSVYRAIPDAQYVENQAYQKGRILGRNAAGMLATAEVVVGTIATGYGLASMAATAGGATATAVTTGGTSLVGGAVLLTAEAVVVVGGVVCTASGISTLAYLASGEGEPLAPREIERLRKTGNAPKELKKAHNPHVPEAPNQHNHIHLDNGFSINDQGSWGHTQGKTPPGLSNAMKDFLKFINWPIPD